MSFRCWFAKTERKVYCSLHKHTLDKTYIIELLYCVIHFNVVDCLKIQNLKGTKVYATA